MKQEFTPVVLENQQFEPEPSRYPQVLMVVVPIVVTVLAALWVAFNPRGWA